MESAEKILIAGGMLNLAYGYLSGLFFASAREKAEHAHRYLVMAHVGPFMQGTMLIALVFAVRLSALSAALESAAAVALVVSAFAIAAKDTVNWLQGVNDEFADRPAVPRLLGLVGAPVGVAGFLVLLVGVLRAL